MEEGRVCYHPPGRRRTHHGHQRHQRRCTHTNQTGVIRQVHANDMQWRQTVAAAYLERVDTTQEPPPFPPPARMTPTVDADLTDPTHPLMGAETPGRPHRSSGNECLVNSTVWGCGIPAKTFVAPGAMKCYGSERGDWPNAQKQLNRPRTVFRLWVYVYWDAGRSRASRLCKSETGYECYFEDFLCFFIGVQ